MSLHTDIYDKVRNLVLGLPEGSGTILDAVIVVSATFACGQGWMAHGTLTAILLPLALARAAQLKTGVRGPGGSLILLIALGILAALAGHSTTTQHDHSP